MKNFIKKPVFRIVDLLIVPFTYLIMPVFRKMKYYGVEEFPLNRSAFKRTGVYPIRDHYYDPQFVYSPDFDFNKVRSLPFDFRLNEQLSKISELKYAQELKNFPEKGVYGSGSYYLQNPSFSYGDADLYYLMIRNLKPKRIIEIGSGYSTLVAVEAIRKNKEEGHTTALTCVEPYEMPWLSELKEVELIRQKVELLDLDFFQCLEEGDFLFIDSSHVIRPENDVLFEYLQLLPSLKKGVYIHIHDIFSPRHYLKLWLNDFMRLWNEQYLLEAFLSYNDSFEVYFSLNYLAKDHYDITSKVLLNLNAEATPASFWLRKTGN